MGANIGVGRGERGDVLLGEGAVEEPGDDGEVLALVEGGEDHRVGVLFLGGFGGRHGDAVCGGGRRRGGRSGSWQVSVVVVETRSGKEWTVSRFGGAAASWN